MSINAVQVTRREKAVWIVIDRQQRRNALNDDVCAGILRGLQEARDQADVAAVVITGSGERAFCAGADLKSDSSEFTRNLTEVRHPGGLLFRALLEHPQPVIARINGICLAGGMGLLAAADLAVSAEDTRFGLPEVKVGVFPMMVCALLIHRLGIRDRDLMELSLLGEPVSADTAHRMGLVNWVVPRSQLDATVDGVVEQLAQRSPSATRLGKFAVRQMRDMPGEQALAYAESQLRLVGLTEDAREGVAAFAEKRAPNWKRS